MDLEQGAVELVRDKARLNQPGQSAGCVVGFAVITVYFYSFQKMCTNREYIYVCVWVSVLVFGDITVYGLYDSFSSKFTKLNRARNSYFKSQEKRLHCMDKSSVDLSSG